MDKPSSGPQLETKKKIHDILVRILEDWQAKEKAQPGPAHSVQAAATDTEGAFQDMDKTVVITADAIEEIALRHDGRQKQQGVTEDGTLMVRPKPISPANQTDQTEIIAHGYQHLEKTVIQSPGKDGPQSRLAKPVTENSTDNAFNDLEEKAKKDPAESDLEKTVIIKSGKLNPAGKKDQ